MDDTEVEINGKIKKAFAPPRVVEGNPCLAYIRHIVLPWNKRFEVSRPAEYGGDKAYETADELEADYAEGKLHPGDVKPALAKAINAILQPVRDHFVNDKEAAALLKQVKAFKVTR